MDLQERIIRDIGRELGRRLPKEEKAALRWKYSIYNASGYGQQEIENKMRGLYGLANIRNLDANIIFPSASTLEKVPQTAVEDKRTSSVLYLSANNKPQTTNGQVVKVRRLKHKVML